MQLPENTSHKIAALHNIAKKLLHENESEEKIITELCKNDISKDYAAIIIDNCLNDIRDKKDFWKLLIMGIFFVMAGVLITYFSYATAENNSIGFYFVYWGIVVSGVIMIFRAFSLYKK